MDINKKDIIAINKEFDEGVFSNESSLDFALEYCKKNIAWTKKLAYLMRAIIVDHVFEEGNKRTACMVLLYCIEEEGYEISDKKATSMIREILMNNIVSVKRIRWIIEDGIK